MIVAGVVIETVPGAEARVAGRLAARGLELAGADGPRLAAVCEAESGEALEALAVRLLEEDAEILGVFPSFVADAEG